MSPAQNDFKNVLFLCSGNYYRSRYAEILFNHLATARGAEWQAFSRGLALDDRNPGPLSQHTRSALERLGIPFAKYLREPQPVSDADFATANHIVAVKEAEHRDIIHRKFPNRLNQVEFWHVHDLDCSEPGETISHLDRLIAELLDRLNPRT